MADRKSSNSQIALTLLYAAGGAASEGNPLAIVPLSLATFYGLLALVDSAREVRLGPLLQESGEEDSAYESELDRLLRQLEEERERVKDLRDQLGRSNKGDKGPRRDIKKEIREAIKRFKDHAKALRAKYGRDAGPSP